GEQLLNLVPAHRLGANHNHSRISCHRLTYLPSDSAGVPSLPAERGHAEDPCAAGNGTVSGPFRAVRELVRVPGTTQRHRESAAMRLATLVSHRYDFGLTWIQAERDRGGGLVLLLGIIGISGCRRIWVRPFL